MFSQKSNKMNRNTKRSGLAFSSSLSVALFLCLTSKAQQHVESQSLLWARYHLTLNTQSPWKISSELEERSYWFPWGQHQIFLRNRVLYKWSKSWNIGGGFTYFDQTLPENPLAINKRVRTELRPQIELSSHTGYGDKWHIQHRYWLEMRYFEQSSGDFEFNSFRIRYLMKVTYLFTKKWSILAFNELHLNAGQNTGSAIFNQNRAGAGFQWQAYPNVGFSLNYFHWYQQRGDGNGFFSRDILRFTVHHKINL